MFRKMSGFLAASLAMGMTLVAAAPVAAQTSRQKNKNLMRNLGIGLGAAAVHQAVKGKKTNAIILGAGAAYSAKRYEDHRKAQARETRRSRVSRVYTYRNGKKVGYYKYVNGKRQGFHSLR